MVEQDEKERLISAWVGHQLNDHYYCLSTAQSGNPRRPHFTCEVFLPQELFFPFWEENKRLLESSASQEEIAASRRAMLRRCVEFLLQQLEAK